MTDRQAVGWQHPERRLARLFELRTRAELANLLTLDALVCTPGMSTDEMEDLILRVRVLYRGDPRPSEAPRRSIGMGVITSPAVRPRITIA